MQFTTSTSIILAQAVALATAHSTVVFSYPSQALNTTAVSIAATSQYSMPAIVESCESTDMMVFGPKTYEATMRRGTCAGDELAQVTAMVMAKYSVPTCAADVFDVKSSVF